jgi:hypothetical protein
VAEFENAEWATERIKRCFILVLLCIGALMAIYGFEGKEEIPGKVRRREKSG